jgi:hypothetical protein
LPLPKATPPEPETAHPHTNLSTVTSGPDYISAEELDLLSFFSSEPKQRDADVPWPYNDSLYEANVDGVSLSFAVAPAYKDVRIILKTGEHIVYELNAVGVDDVKYHNDGGRETLEIIVSPRDRLWLRVAPRIQVSHTLAASEA